MLQRQKIALPITDGIDTKADEKTVLPTRFLELVNVNRTKPGTFTKRFGYEALSRKTLDALTITSGSALTNLKSELLQYSNSRLYSYSEGELAWKDKGEVKFCSAFSKQVSSDSNILQNPSMWSINGVSCYAWERKVQSITHNPGLGPDVVTEYINVDIAIIDDASGATLKTLTVTGAEFGSPVLGKNVYAPKVGVAGSKFIVFYYVDDGATNANNGLVWLTIDLFNPSNVVYSLSSGSRLAPRLTTASSRHYDVCSFNSCCYVTYVDGSGNVLIRYFDSNTMISSPTTLAGSSANLYCFTINKQNNNVRVTWTTTTGYPYTILLNSTLSAFVHPIKLLNAISGIVEGGYSYIGSCESPDNADKTTLVFTNGDFTTTSLGMLCSGTVDISGNYAGLGDTSVFPFLPILMHGAQLQSKLVVVGGYVYFFVVRQISAAATSSTYVTVGGTPQTNKANKPVRTLFLMKSLGSSFEIAARYEMESHVVTYADEYAGLPNIFQSGNTITMPIAALNGVQPVNATKLLAPSVIKTAVADFSQLSNYFDATQGESLYVSGGILKQYDGDAIVESGFLDTPPPIKDIANTGGAGFGDYYTASTGGLTNNSSYQYCVVYKWTDRTGKVHRSAPSRVVQTTTPATVGEYRVNITFTPLYFTNKKNVQVELYRTTANGTVFYNVSHVVQSAGSDNILTGTYSNGKYATSITDNVADVELVYAEPLYTTGGELENDAPDASSFVAAYKSRLFLFLSDGYTLQYSKETGLGEPVRFSAAFKVPLDNEGGPATCGITMDDHFLIFKERAIFALTGEGPNSLGQQGDFKKPYLVTTDAGCIDPNSLVLTPNGVMFKSLKGIYMLKRNFALQYVGDSVEAFNDKIVVSSTLLSTVNQVRFILENNIALVYDYYANSWTTYDNIRGVDALEFNGTYYYVTNDGYVMKETPGAYKDNGQFIPMKIRSSWIQIGGVQGFQRFYKMLLLGNYKSPHKLQVSFSFDYNNYYVENTVIDATAVIAETTYGSGTYGTESPYGGEGNIYQFQVNPSIQKCQSFTYTIEDVRTTEDGASFELSHVLAEVGIKQGTGKLPDGKSFGTSG